MVLETNSPDREDLLRLARRQSVLAFDFHDASEDHNLATVGFFVLGPTAKGAVAALTNFFCAADPVVRRTSIGCLVALGPAAQDAVPALIPEISDTDTAVRGSAKLALGAIHAQPAIAVPALIANLSARDGSTRLTVLALGKFGAEAKVAVPALLPLLNDPNRDLRSATSNALKQIDSEAATKARVR
jgi:HEAT repeat protein